VTLVGKHYDIKNYHCAHFVAQWYRDRLGIDIPVSHAFETSFVVWMRRHFTPIQTPVSDCLVLMTKAGERHVGVYADYGVYHNYKAGNALGAVVHWDLGVIKRNYDEVSFWLWSPSNTTKTR